MSFDHDNNRDSLSSKEVDSVHDNDNGNDNDKDNADGTCTGYVPYFSYQSDSFASAEATLIALTDAELEAICSSRMTNSNSINAPILREGSIVNIL